MFGCGCFDAFSHICFIFARLAACARRTAFGPLVCPLLGCLAGFLCWFKTVLGLDLICGLFLAADLRLELVYCLPALF